MGIGLAINTPTPPRHRLVSREVPLFHTPLRCQADSSAFDTPSRNLFSVRQPRLIDHAMNESPSPGRGPTVLSFSDSESSESEGTESEGTLSQSQSTSEATTVSWAASESSERSDTLDYMEVCRRLSLSPMVQPAKHRRCRSYTPSTEASSITLDSGRLSPSSLLSQEFDD